MDQVYMKSGHTGEVKAVDAVPAEIVKLMVAGWSQCAPPSKEQPAAMDVQEQIHEESEK